MEDKRKSKEGKGNTYVDLKQTGFSCAQVKYNLEDTDFTLFSMSVIFFD